METRFQGVFDQLSDMMERAAPGMAAAERTADNLVMKTSGSIPRRRSRRGSERFRRRKAMSPTI